MPDAMARPGTGGSAAGGGPVRPIVLADLDDTLFQTTRKAPPGPDWMVAAVDRDGAPMSWMSPPQRALYDWLAATTELVPVTGRNLAALGRVRLSFAAPAVCSHGGVVLTAAGTPCPVWAARMGAIAEASAAAMADFAEAALAGGEDVRARVIEDAGLALYVSVKHNRGDAGVLARLGERLRPQVPADWTLHCNSNNMALIPPGITKADAVRHLLDLLGHDGSRPVLALGDSLSDLPFMALADLAAVPRASQIAARLAPEGS